MKTKPAYTLREKLNNRLLKFNAYLCGKGYQQKLLKQVITANNNIFNNVINFHCASNYSFSVALNLVLSEGIDCVIDVGANEGQFAQHVLASGFQGKVISFEPQQNVFTTLENNSVDYENWDVHELGISTIGGEQQLNVFSGHQFSSMHEPSSKRHHSAGSQLSLKERVVIRTVRLDDFIEEHYPAINSGSQTLLLKTDTQGHDLDVLASSERILQKIHVIIMELSLIPIYQKTPLFDEAVQFVDHMGFAPMGFFSINNSAPNFASVEMDGIFVRK